jgi:hypothetical protein
MLALPGIILATTWRGGRSERVSVFLWLVPSCTSGLVMLALLGATPAATLRGGRSERASMFPKAGALRASELVLLALQTPAVTLRGWE